MGVVFGTAVLAGLCGKILHGKLRKKSCDNTQPEDAVPTKDGNANKKKD